MKRSNKKLILLTMLLFIFVLTGCDKFHIDTYDASEENADPKITSIENNQNDIDDKDFDDSKLDDSNLDVEEDNETISAVTNKSEPPTPSGIQPAVNNELLIYTISEDAKIKAVTALIPMEQEITPQLIVDTVVVSMSDNSLMIGVESVTTQDDSVVVSFYSDQPPLKNVGGGVEAEILDAIAQSIIDNLDDYSKVVYREEGNAYKSDHIELGIDEVYLGDN